MNITLKNLSIHKKLSRETVCFTADICVDGKVVGDVQNDGNGGCNFYGFNDPKVGKACWDYAKEKYTEFNFKQLDSLIDELIQKEEENKTFKRWCKTGTFFQLHGDKPTSWRTVRHAGNKKTLYSPQTKAWIEKTYGKKLKEILNERFL